MMSWYAHHRGAGMWGDISTGEGVTFSLGDYTGCGKQLVFAELNLIVKCTGHCRITLTVHVGGLLNGRESDGAS